MVRDHKTIEERLIQSVHLLKKLKNDGLNIEYDSAKQFRVILNSYVRDGVSYSGKIHVQEEQIYIHYILTTSKKKNCRICLSKK